MNQEFHLLRRELQQRVPLPRILSHIDKLLKSCSPLEFQNRFIEDVARRSAGLIDASLLMKVSRHLLSKFDQFYGGAKYALEDEFVDFFASQSSSDSAGKCDRFYELDSRIIHIKASESMISEGTTGDKRVLELGSGTGLGGLTVATCCDPVSVTLTDVAQVHDAFTRPNLLLNPFNSAAVTSEIVYWNDLDANPEDFSTNFDVILGCDLVYDPEVVVMLLDALKSLLLYSKSTIYKAILLCTLRNPQTFDDFIADLQREPLLNVLIEEIREDIVNPSIILQSLESFRIVTVTKKSESE